MTSIRGVIDLNTKWIALAVAVSAMAACSPSAERSAEGTQTSDAKDDLPIDRHDARSNADGSPGWSALESAQGVLSYDEGCLFLEREGVRTGLLMPANSAFDGETLKYRNHDLPIGSHQEFTGDILAGAPNAGSACKMDMVLEVAP